MKIFDINLFAIKPSAKIEMKPILSMKNDLTWISVIATLFHHLIVLEQVWEETTNYKNPYQTLHCNQLSNH